MRLIINSYDYEISKIFHETYFLYRVSYIFIDAAVIWCDKYTGMLLDQFTVVQLSMFILTDSKETNKYSETDVSPQTDKNTCFPCVYFKLWTLDEVANALEL